MRLEIGQEYKLSISNFGCQIRWRKSDVERCGPLDYVTKTIGKPITVSLIKKTDFSRIEYRFLLTMTENLKFQDFCKACDVEFSVDAIDTGRGEMTFYQFGVAVFIVPFALLAQDQW